MACVYGADVQRLLRADYECYVGLWLNRDRAGIRQANVHRIGTLATQSPLRLGWFLATNDSDDEARAAYEEFTLAYAEARGSR